MRGARREQRQLIGNRCGEKTGRPKSGDFRDDEARYVSAKYVRARVLPDISLVKIKLRIVRRDLCGRSSVSGRESRLNAVLMTRDARRYRQETACTHGRLHSSRVDLAFRSASSTRSPESSVGRSANFRLSRGLRRRKIDRSDPRSFANRFPPLRNNRIMMTKAVEYVYIRIAARQASRRWKINIPRSLGKMIFARDGNSSPRCISN